MPIYEYECAQCGGIEEVFQKFSDRPKSRCNTCSGKLHKLISQSTFHLKGTGWYVTDYAGKSGKATQTSPKASSASTSTGTSKASSSASSKKPSSTSKKST